MKAPVFFDREKHRGKPLSLWPPNKLVAIKNASFGSQLEDFDTNFTIGVF